ncbi:carbon-nitrogen hydrolase family protein [Chloroflexota bacterium]
MSNMIKIASVQMNPKLMQNDKNLDCMMNSARKAAEQQAKLIVFPECSLTGYVFTSREEALPFAETIPGPSTEKMAALCREKGVYIVFGLLEKAGDKLFNAQSFVGPGGFIAGYRKNHLPYLGVDRFVNKGNRPIRIHETPIGKVGLIICYDVLFPEGARVMALLGADIIIMSTNFPQGRGEPMNCVARARALENKVYMLSSDRVGTERGFGFSGLSTIISDTGQVLSLASADKEEIIYAEVDLETARQKHRVFVPGEWEIDNISDRRPEIYSLITRKN